MRSQGGQSRALTIRPEVIFYDEPTTGLDPVTKGTTISLIRECHEKAGFSAVIVTHEVFRVFPVIDHIAMLSEGKISFYGTPEEMLQSKQNDVAAFVEASFQGGPEEKRRKPGTPYP